MATVSTMKDVKINSRLQRVFVLKESEDRLVYIPVKSLHRVDYERLKKMSGEKPPRMDLLDFMAKKKLDNGINALVQFDGLIQVSKQFGHSNLRLKKPDEVIRDAEINASVVAAAEQTGDITPAKEKEEVERVGEYVFTNKHGKEQTWGGKGRVPDVLQEYAANGGDIDDFFVKG